LRHTKCFAAFLPAKQHNEARDNDWLRLTSDDRRVQKLDWSVAMRRLLLAAMMLGVVTSARAADLPFLRGGFTDGYSRPIVNWQGVYAGAQGSWGSVNSNLPGNINRDMQASFDQSPPPGIRYNWGSTGIAHKINGGYGAFVGYNSQWDDVVIGIEGNYIHDNFHANSFGNGTAIDLNNNGAVVGSTYTSASLNLTDFGSLRVRAGYAVNCFLPYIFVGGGFGSQTLDRTTAANPPPVGPAWMTDSSSKLIYGYTAGGGIDVVLAGGLFGRAEYEYKRVTSNFDSTINSARLGLGYKF
jgi:opacity protein-like surface antigen